jgi:hypothetical protein
MNRPLGEVLADIIVETGQSPQLFASNMRLAASPHIRTNEDCWIWMCEITIPVTTFSCIEKIIGRGDTADEAATDCYRMILAADRSTWKQVQPTQQA